MSTFLSKIAKHILENYSDDLQNLCVILPNRRSHIFLKNELSLLAKSTIWSPNIFSIDDFVFEISDLSPSEPISLLFELYSLYLKEENDEKQGFDEFASWGETLLKDFNDLDHYLIDSSKLYNYLNEVKAIERWNADGEPLSENEKLFLKFYNSFETYYKGMRNQLLEKKVAWQGLACRSLVENPECFENRSYKHYIFAGFNALTPAEDALISHLKKDGKATVLWDFDKYYLENKNHEAALFARRHLKRDPKLSFVGDAFNQKKDIKIIGAPKNIGQVEYAVQLLKKIANGEEKSSNGEKINLGEVAVILNEGMLAFPLISAMPPEVGKYNLTMGLPFKLSPLFGLLDQWINMQINNQQLAKARSSSKNVPFYLRDISQLLAHPYIVSLVKSWGLETFSELKYNLNDANKNNRAFLTVKGVKEFLLTNSKLAELSFLFEEWSDNVEKMISAMEKMIEVFISLFCDSEQSEIYHLDREFLFVFNKVIIRGHDLLESFPKGEEISAFAMSRILLQLARQSTVPFKGEPLQGVQVMGMLESRTLDFKYIIMLSANEGCLPSTATDNSFIPFDVKREFGLPTFKTRDAVMAYHFYRLMQGCEKGWLLYNTEAELLGGGDKSRFLTQMLYELKSYNPQIELSNSLLAEQPIIEGVDFSPHGIEKSVVYKKLLKFAQNGISASSLNVFISCPLRFCLQNVLGIAPPDEAAEKIDASVFGTVVHGALEELFNECVKDSGTLLKAENLELLLPKVNKTVDSEFAKVYAKGDIEHGKNYLIKQVACRMVSNYLRTEIAQIKKDKTKQIFTTYIESERRLEHSIKIKVENDFVECKIKGFVDRIDQRSGVVRILDYKTGKVEAKDLKLENIEDVFTNPKYAKLNQLVLYAWLYKCDKKWNDDKVSSGIIPLKHPLAGLFFANEKNDDILKDSLLQEYEENLFNILEELLNPNGSFEPTDDKKQCEYCHYISFCGK